MQLYAHAMRKGTQESLPGSAPRRVVRSTFRRLEHAVVRKRLVVSRGFATRRDALLRRGAHSATRNDAERWKREETKRGNPHITSLCWIAGVARLSLAGEGEGMRRAKRRVTRLVMPIVQGYLRRERGGKRWRPGKTAVI